ncbi:DedA family protein [Gemmata sp. G18]|uniref:DedA family protein n=1 Tax=Gemmata palustris TaxID=2822762 RepID=A0ABS5BYL4_9BACT|nr:DedA family protein [Gemmata palustris]MBP3958799.1 DedA family protein [Gemmata palustris]
MTDAIYWYASIFFWLFLTGIGLPPVPEEAGILYAASVNALHSEVWWSLAWAACGLGIIAADCVLYGVGWRWGPKLFEYRWVQKVLSAERRQRLEGHFTQHGMKLLILSRFLPPVRTGVFLIAGATRYSFLKFLVADLIYAVVGVGLFFFCGTWILGLIHRFESTALVVGALLVMGYGLYMYYRLLRRREPNGASEAPTSILQGPGGSAPAGEPVKNPAAAVAAQKEALTVFESK